jgi:hypothetical protein
MDSVAEDWRLKMKYLCAAITLLTLVLSSCANVPANVQENTLTATEAASAGSIEVVGGDEEALREFIRQWAVPSYSDGSSQGITVYIGSTPNDVPYELPTPADSRTIGSITGTWADYMLIFDSNLTAESIHKFYEQSLIDQGWKEAPTMGGGGFTGQSSSYRWYCYGENEAVLGVETPSAPNKKSSIRLTLDLSPDPHMCSADPNYGSTPISVIPELKAPKGISVQGTGAGSSDRDAQVTANLKGDLRLLKWSTSIMNNCGQQDGKCRTTIKEKEQPGVNGPSRMSRETIGSGR